MHICDTSIPILRLNARFSKYLYNVTCAMTTNETKELSKEECNKLNINYNLFSVYPWENVTEELDELNNS